MQSSIPFARLSSREWTNLGLAALACLYLLFTVYQLAVNRPLVYVGTDFPALVASSNIAREHGLAAVYDLNVQKQYQNQIYRSVLGIDWPHGTSPNAFLPVFVLLMLPLALFDPFAAYLLWTALSLVVLLLYLRRIQNVLDWNGQGVGYLVLSLPAFFTLLSGQVNVWLAICVGEALIALRRQHNVQAGAWLAGLLLKPQVMILLIPGLVLAGKFKAAISACISGLVIIAVSTLLVGTEGMLSLLALWTGFAQPQGLATNSPELMMNWRGLAIRLNQVLPDSSWGWGLMVAGMLATAAVGLALWRSRPSSSAVDIDKIWIGTLSATFAVTWHSHVHMALPLVIVLAFLWADSGQLPLFWFIWLILPSLFFLTAAFLLGTAWAHTYLGIFFLLLNVSGVIWAYCSLRQQSPIASAA